MNFTNRECFTGAIRWQHAHPNNMSSSHVRRMALKNWFALKESLVEVVVFLIQSVAGVIGGNVIGAIQLFTQRAAGNTLLGMSGGILAGQLVNQLGFGIGLLKPESIVINCVSGVVGGAFLVLVTGGLRVILARDG